MKDRVIKYNKLYIIVLLFLGIITHIEWFNPQSILNDGDWGYLTSEEIKELDLSQGSWLNLNFFGGPNLQIHFNFFMFFWYLLGSFGFSFDTATKFTFLIPIALGGFIFPYILAKKLIEDSFISFLGALFYGSTTYFILRQTAHLPVAFIYMMAPIFLFFLIKTINNNKFIDWVFFSLLNLILIGYEVRMVYVLYLMGIIYWIVFFKSVYIRLEYLKNYTFFCLNLLLLNIYWIAPTIMGSSQSIEETANRGLFGGSLFNILRSFTISESGWTGSYPNIDFIPQSIPLYLFAIPVLIFLGLYLTLNSKNNNDKKYGIFFGAISLLGIILTTQQSVPFPGLYEFLYKNFPGFNLFRESSKFYLLTSIGYLGLLSLSLKQVKNYLYELNLNYLYFLLSISLISIFFYNIKPLLTREIGTTFVSKSVPNDYTIFNNFILSEENHFRTFWIPIVSRYGISTVKNNVVSNNDFLNKFKLFFDFTPNTPVYDKLTAVYKKEFSDTFFDNSNIKFIVVPIRDTSNEDNFFKYFGEDKNINIRERYISELNKIKWLEKKDLGFEDLVVYENKGFKDRIYLTREPETINKDIQYKKVEFIQITPSEYKVKIYNLETVEYLNFVESYDSNWKLRIGNFDWKPVLYEKNYFLDESKHSKSDIGFNSFEISKEYIKNNFHNSVYKNNSNGSIDLEVTVYFKPQSYFYFGIIISTITLMFCLIYIVIYMIIYKKNKFRLN